MRGAHIHPSFDITPLKKQYAHHLSAILLIAGNVLCKTNHRETRLFGELRVIIDRSKGEQQRRDDVSRVDCAHRYAIHKPFEYVATSHGRILVDRCHGRHARGPYRLQRQGYRYPLVVLTRRTTAPRRPVPLHGSWVALRIFRLIHWRLRLGEEPPRQPLGAWCISIATTQ